MSKRFYQKSKILCTPPCSDDVYHYGETTLTIAANKFSFDLGVKVPHEIFHLYTWELSKQFGFPMYHLFSNSDEITSDYLEEIFALSINEDNKLIFDISSIDRSISNILDCSIVFLQLQPLHTKIEQKYQRKVPIYGGWKTSVSPLHEDLTHYQNTGQLSPVLEYIQKNQLSKIGDTWAKYAMAAHYGKMMFNLLLRNRNVAIDGEKLIVTFDDENDYLYAMHREVQDYFEAFNITKHQQDEYVEFCLE